MIKLKSSLIVGCHCEERDPSSVIAIRQLAEEAISWDCRAPAGLAKTISGAFRISQIGLMGPIRTYQFKGGKKDKNSSFKQEKAVL